MITIVSLGVTAGDLTERAKRTLSRADEVLVRTGALPSVEGLKEAGIAYETLDFLYESSRNYDTVVQKIVREVRRRGRAGHVAYCVDGSVYEDAAARALLAKGGAAFVEGKSKATHFASLSGVGGAYTAVSAFSVGEKRLALPLVVYDLTDDNLSDVKLALSECFGDEAPACLVRGETAEEIPLYEADRRGKCGALAGLVLREQPLPVKERYDFEDFVAIMRRLRAPDGCPWDRAQTHESIRINAIEEAYELVDAVDLADPAKMREEAGDVLMQAVFHALIEEEKGNFTVGDMLTELCEKLVTRHTHIFGADHAENAESALSVWEKNKMTEKHQSTYSDAVNDVPEVFPALLRAQKVAKRAAKGGWDFSLSELEERLRGDFEALKAAHGAGDAAAVAERLGDVLTDTVGIGRCFGGDCEQALLDAVKRTAALYGAFEALVCADGKDPAALTDGERDAYIERARHAAHG